jgi:hypothetical protein
VGAQIDLFGTGVDVEGDTLVVSASIPRGPLSGGYPIVHVFSRSHGGSTAWTLAARFGLPYLPLEAAPGPVDISGDTLVAELRSGSGFISFVFQQNGGPDVWGEVARVASGSTSEGAGRISGDLVVVGASFPNRNPARVYARNQGGADQWGEVPHPSFAAAGGTAISGDTILLAGPPTGQSPIEVYVADTDRDGLRDGLDACPRDPLNNVEGGCTRNSAAYLVLDDLITLGEVATETRGNEFLITATFTNTSDTAIGNPFFEVAELTGGNLLVNADAGPGGTGATLSPDAGDGVLSPGESITTTFVIALETPEPFRLYVSVRGETGLQGSRLARIF